MNGLHRTNASGSGWPERAPNQLDSGSTQPETPPPAARRPAATGGLSDLQHISSSGSTSRASAPPRRASVGRSAASDAVFSADQMREIDEIAHELTVDSVVAAKPGQPQSPVSGIWDKLVALESMCGGLRTVQIDALRERLLDAIGQSAHSREDADLLRQVVSALTQRADARPLHQVMADITFERMQLPELELDSTGQTVPDSRYFNSALVPLVELAYDHDPMGRTLLWKGACTLFPGPGRAEKLDLAIFSLAKDSGLVSPFDFYLAVDALGLDEEVTDQMLDEMRRKAGDGTPPR